jgi:hypothetical protein
MVTYIEALTIAAIYDPLPAAKGESVYAVDLGAS